MNGPYGAHSEGNALSILESQLNGRIAYSAGTHGSSLERVWRKQGRVSGQPETAGHPDCAAGRAASRVENEYLPAHTVESETLARLGESLDASVVQASGRINAAVALRSPPELHDCAGLDDVDRMLEQGVTLEYALFAGPGGVDRTRFPKSGFIPGNIRDLAAFVEFAATPEDAVQRAVTILEEGVQDAAAILRQAEQLSGDTQMAIPEYLKQPYSEQTLRMAATIMVNALVFHQNLAGQHGVRNLEQIASDDVLTQASVLEEWRKILGINYWSIFNIASDLLRSVNPPGMAVEALRVMRRTADRLVALGVSQSHDLSGNGVPEADSGPQVPSHLLHETGGGGASGTPRDTGRRRLGGPAAGQRFSHRGLRLRHGHTYTRGVPTAEPASLACGGRPGASARAHDGECVDSVRRAAVVSTPDSIDAVVVISTSELRWLTHNRSPIREDRVWRCIHRLARPARRHREIQVADSYAHGHRCDRHR